MRKVELTDQEWNWLEPLRPKRIVGDKGYCGRPTRNLVRRRGIRFTIAKRRNLCRTGPFDRSLYRQRNAIERTITRIKQFHRVATRYEKRADKYRSISGTTDTNQCPDEEEAPALVRELDPQIQYILGDTHYKEPGFRLQCEQEGRFIVN
jgi:transposase